MSGDWKRSYGANCDTGSGRKPPVNGTASQPTATAPVVDSTHADAFVVEEAGEGRPAVEHVVHRFGHLGRARQASPFFAHPTFQSRHERGGVLAPRRSSLGRGMAVHRALDGEQLVHAPHSLERQGRHDGHLLLSASARRGFDVGQLEELSPRVSPARGLEDRRGLALAEIQLAITSIGVGLKHADPAGEVSLRVLAPSVGREVEQSRRGIGTAEGTVVAHVDPHASRGGLALGQHRYGGVVAVQAPSRHDMRFDEPEQRLQHRRAGAHLIGQRRQAEGHALTGIALGLAVQRLELFPSGLSRRAW